MARNRGAMETAVRGRSGFYLKGDKEMEATLKSMDLNKLTRIAEQAVGFGVRPVITATKKNIRAAGLDHSGLLQKSIGVRRIAYKRTGTGVAIVGARRKKFARVIEEEKMLLGTLHKFRKKWNPTNYFHLVELGTKPHSMVMHAQRTAKGNLVVVKASKAGQPGVFAIPFNHPGNKAHNVLRDATVSTKTQVHDRIVTRFEHLVKKEIERRASR